MPPCDQTNEACVQFLINKKLEMFDLVATVSITWWITIVVFEATFVAGMILKRKELLQLKSFRTASNLGEAFILLSIFYGVVIFIYYAVLKGEIYTLLKMTTMPSAIFDSEFLFALITAFLGTLSLVFLFCCYRVVSNSIRDAQKLSH